jgi:hypothetical protein
MIFIDENMLQICQLKSNTCCVMVFVYQIHSCGTRNLMQSPIFIFLICVWFQNIIETARAPNRNADTLFKVARSKQKWFF